MMKCGVRLERTPAMPDFNTVSDVVLGLSVSVSVVQAGNWLLNADPAGSSPSAAGRLSGSER